MSKKESLTAWMNEDDFRVAENLKHDAINVLKVFGLERPGWPVFQREIGCLLAVVFYALRKAEEQNCLVDMNVVFRWKKIILSLLTADVSLLRSQASKAEGEEGQ